MSAPVLLSLADAHAVVRQGLPPLSGGDSVAHFVVVRHGECVHGQWGAGEVLVCRGEARDGDLVVLVARGHGRPRVGTVRGGRLYGDAGEPCHAGRWTVAGRLVATWRQRDGGWICALTDGDDGSVPVASVPSPPSEQLSLFGIAA